MSARLNVDSSVATTLNPKKSQVVLLGLIGAACLSLLLSCYLFTLDNHAAFYFFGLACLLPVGAMLGWYKSQSDVDMADSQATHVTLPNGAEVITDSRVLRSPEGLSGFAQLIQDILARRPLPVADGVVGADMQILPESGVEAQSRTDQINQTVHQSTNELIGKLGLSDEKASALQVLKQ